MSKYTLEFKITVIRAYLDNTHRSIAIARQYGIARETLHRWVARWRYHGESGLVTGIKHIYSPDFKIQVVKFWLDNPLPVSEIAARFNIPSYMTVNKWVKLYQSGGADAFNFPPDKQSPPMPVKPRNRNAPPEEMTREELIEELAYRRAELAYLKKLDALTQQKKIAQQKKQK
jgi:transposase